MDWLGGKMNIKCKRLRGILLVLLSFIILGSNLTVSANSSVTDWCKVHMKQGNVGHTAGCTVVTLQLILQNSGVLKSEYQLDGDVTSSTSGYSTFNSAVESSGMAKGDGWQIGSFVSGANTLCDATWSTDTASSAGDSKKGSYSGVIDVVTGVGDKNFVDMTHDEQLAVLKAFWNSGYFMVFCVTYTGAEAHNNGRDGFWANHATMVAGVDDSAIYLNDPASGTIVNYDDCTNGGHPYNLVYLVTFKNDKTSPNKLSSGGNVNITNKDKNNATKIGLNANMFYSESDLSAYVRLGEVDISAMLPTSREDLNQNELENLASWENNVKNSKKEYGFIAWLRIIVMWVGILFTIYIFLLYLAYWFDKINSLVDLDVLSLLTFGHLHVAMNEKEANFSLGKKQDRTTVSHKDMCFICIVGLIFGTLLITGTFYKIISNFVNFIIRKLG